MHRPKSIPFLRFVLIIFFPEVLMVDKMTDRQTDKQTDKTGKTILDPT